MGWSDCGVDSNGRPIGYSYDATCDHPGCEASIDRGLSYACGGMHGENESCEFYFCSDHLKTHYTPDDKMSYNGNPVCELCGAIATIDWYEEQLGGGNETPTQVD